MSGRAVASLSSARGRLTRLGLLAILLPLLLTACTSSWRRLDDLGDPRMRTDARTVRPLDPRTVARSDPVTAEEAAKDMPGDAEAAIPMKDSVPLTIEQARAAAVANDLGLAVQLVDPAMAAQALAQERAKFEASFGIQAQVARSPSQGILTPKTTTWNLEPSLNVPLATGGTFTIGLPFSISETPFATEYEGAVRFSLSQPLLQGAGWDVNTASIRVAALQEHLSSAQTTVQVVDVLLQVEEDYWNYYAARRNLDVAREQFDRMQKQVTQSEELVKAGILASVEVLRSRASVASQLQSVIQARTSVLTTLRQLKSTMNRPDLPVGGSTMIDVKSNPVPLGWDFDRSLLVEAALANRRELLEARITLAIDALNADLARDDLKPQVGVALSWYEQGTGSRSTRALHDIYNGAFPGWSAGITATIPLGNRAAEAAWRKARLQLIADRANAHLQEQIIIRDVHDALDALEGAWQQILAARQEVLLATQAFDGQRELFRLGNAATTDVIDAAETLTDAQSGEVQSLADYRISLAQLAAATGTLLGHSRVEWTSPAPPSLP